MKNNYLLILLFGLCWNQAIASHIVGGEFSLQFKGGRSSTYILSLNLYVDAIHGNHHAIDAQIKVSLFSQLTHARTDTFTLYKVKDSLLTYNEPTCREDGRVSTRLIRYSREIPLSASIYNQASGYYLVWERCCRNEEIDNIVRSGDAGIVFYLEFPAIIQEEQRFNNSAPQFGSLPADFACVNQPFQTSFAATDADGDQLVYHLVEPLKGRSAQGEAIPVPTPGPYPAVSWAAGYSASYPFGSRVITGLDPRTGLLTFKANRIGLYAFAVRCEEYRNGVKIGESRREFQIKVLDCQPNQPPALFVRQSGQRLFYEERQILTLQPTDELCLDILATDEKAHSPLQLKAQAKAASSLTLVPASGSLAAPNDTLRSQLCLPACLFTTPDQPVEIVIMVTDQGCPQGKSDSVRVWVILEGAANRPPAIATDLAENQLLVYRGQSVQIQVTGWDADKDPILLSAKGQGFDLSASNMQFEQQSGVGPFQSSFLWQPDCSLPEGTYTIDFLVEDQACDQMKDTLSVRMLLEDHPFEQNQFEPPNVFTPNGDGVNDFFEIPTLPLDNCQNHFQRVQVVDRWGKELFSAQNRDFRWAGNKVPTGVYYYIIHYSQTTYKSILSLLR